MDPWEKRFGVRDADSQIQGLDKLVWSSVWVPSYQLTWNLKGGPFDRKMVFQDPPVRFHVNWEGRWLQALFNLQLPNSPRALGLHQKGSRSIK